MIPQHILYRVKKEVAYMPIAKTVAILLLGVITTTACNTTGRIKARLPIKEQTTNIPALWKQGEEEGAGNVFEMNGQIFVITKGQSEVSRNRAVKNAKDIATIALVRYIIEQRGVLPLRRSEMVDQNMVILGRRVTKEGNGIHRVTILVGIPKSI